MRVYRHRMGVLTDIFLAVALVITGASAGAQSREGITETKAVFTLVSWQENFDRTLHAPWARTHVAAFSPTSPPRLLLTVDQSERALYLWREKERSKLGDSAIKSGKVTLPEPPPELTRIHPDTDLWIADADGSHARLLRNFNASWVKTLVWSPDGQKLLYQLVPAVQDHKLRPTQLHVMDLKSRKSWQIADQSEEMPTWGADSKSILFWRKLADAVITPEGNVASYAHWQLFRAEAPWEKPQTGPISRTLVSDPTSILPDGNRILYITAYREPDNQLHLGPSAVETLATGLVEPLAPSEGHLPDFHPGDIEFPYDAPLWSGNSRWMFHLSSLRFGRVNMSLYDIVEHRKTDLSPILNSWADTVLKRTSGEGLRILSANRIGPDDSLLLLEVGTFTFHGDIHRLPLPPDAPPKYGWVVYDPVQGKMLSVEGLPQERGPFLTRTLYRVGSHYCLLPLASQRYQDRLIP